MELHPTLMRLARLFLVPCVVATAIVAAATPAIAEDTNPTEAPKAEVCTTGVDAEISGQTVTFHNWNGKDCILSALSYVRTGPAKFPQKLTALSTGIVKANDMLTLGFNAKCEQHDAINGTDAPETLTGDYFGPNGTLLTADDSGLWKTECETPKVKPQVSWSYSQVSCSVGNSVLTLTASKGDIPTDAIIVSNDEGETVWSGQLNPEQVVTVNVPIGYGEKYEFKLNVGGKDIDSGTVAQRPTEAECFPKTNVKFEAKVLCSAKNGTATYALDVRTTDGSTATFTPANGTQLSSGNSIVVTATWSDPHYGTQTSTVNATPSADCTPPPVKTVCPSGVVVFGNTACPPVPTPTKG